MTTRLSGLLLRVPIFITAVCLCTSCITNPVTPANYDPYRFPPSLGPLFGLPLPGVPQFINGEPIEGALYLGIGAAGYIGGGLIAVSGDELTGIGIMMGGMMIHMWSMLDGVITLIARQGQFEETAALLEDREKFIVIESVEINPVFSGFYQSYRDEPIGRAVIRNISEWKIEDISIILNSGEYTETQNPFVLDTPLFPGETAEITLTTAFSRKLTRITDNTTLSGELQVSYRVRNRTAVKTAPVSIPVFHRNAMTWEDDRRLSGFISGNDAAARLFTRSTIGRYTSLRGDSIPADIQTAMQIFNALGAYGCVYVIDPASSFIELREQKTAVDFIQYPRQTLESRTGDCDDLVVLFTSLLESAGIETALVTVPGHIFMAFRTDLDKNNLTEAYKTKFILTEEEVWLPVEVTMLGQSFIDAWNMGAKQYTARKQENTAAIYKIHEAWKLYPPVPVSDKGFNIPLPAEEILAPLIKLDTSLLANMEVWN